MEESIKNDGGSYKNLQLETLDKQIKASKVWSEGRKSLEELLLYCMQNGIKTVACCAGHYHEGDKDMGDSGYIGFDFGDKNTREVISKLISMEISQKQNTTTVIHRIKSNDESIDLKEIYIQNERGEDDDIFSRLLQEIQEILQEKEKNQSIDNKTQKMLEFLNIECKDNVIFEMSYLPQKDELDSLINVKGIAPRGCEKLKFEQASRIMDYMKEDMCEIHMKDVVRSAIERVKQTDVESVKRENDKNVIKNNDGNFIF